MCIIVDTNRMGRFLQEPYREEVAPIHKWLNKSGRLVYSIDGSFADEVNENAKKKLEAYSRKGCASLIPAEHFEDLKTQLRNNSKVKSNDHHILALAQHTGARILYTGDHNLMKDFNHHKLINDPRGKIYSNQRQAHLLKNSACRRTQDILT